MAASVLSRLVARIIDFLIISLLFFLVMPLIFAVFGAVLGLSSGEIGLNASQSDMDAFAQSFASRIGIIWGVAVLIVYLFNEVFLVAQSGGNVGKKILGLVVVDQVSGGNISMGKAFVRFCIFLWPFLLMMLIGWVSDLVMGVLITFVLPIWMIVLFASVCFVGKSGLGFHDKWSKSKVIKKQKLG